MGTVAVQQIDAGNAAMQVAAGDSVKDIPEYSQYVSNSYSMVISRAEFHRALKCIVDETPTYVP